MEDSADNLRMEMNEVMPIVTQVLLNKTVWIAFFVAILYMKFVSFVQHYRKRPPKLRKVVQKKVSAPAPKPAENAEGEKSEEETEAK